MAITELTAAGPLPICTGFPLSKAEKVTLDKPFNPCQGADTRRAKAFEQI